MINRKIDAFLFDFDGTFADTSSDMINCLNILLENHSLNKVSLDTAKNVISKGSGGLIDFACPNLDEISRKEFIKEYLDIYKINIFHNTHIYEGIEDITNFIVSNNYKWGIVTNKPSFLVKPIIDLLKLKNKPQCIVSGDTLKVKKPNPEPLLYAAKLINCDPIYCAYIGDDIRDIVAANTAGMFSVIASYGFIDDLNEIKKWSSDYIIKTPLDLKNLII
tara:strand:+ start:581 stop:1240 length:660 start_codon:yes stop_codon:yes gene_type:complete